MQNINILKKTKHSNSFKVNTVKGMFDFQNDESIFEYNTTIDLPKKWQIGVIVGPSGSGKTTVAQELFGEFFTPKFESQCFIDDIPTDVKNTSRILTSVGLSSVPDWLKPYSVLSNGQKMRADLAQAIASDNSMILFDEFTSVVDRKIAQICSYSISKAIRKTNKQFVAVSCHYDILDWLEPDWVFDTQKKTLFTKNLKDHQSKLIYTNKKDNGIYLNNIII